MTVFKHYLVVVGGFSMDEFYMIHTIHKKMIYFNLLTEHWAEEKLLGNWDLIITWHSAPFYKITIAFFVKP